MAASSMEQLAQELEPHNVQSIFVYSHEAHPGEDYPHHTSFEQKRAHARTLRDTYGIARPILVDSLSGDCHRAYGSMPNMSWIVSRAGLPVYKADWTDVDSIRSAIHDLLSMVERRKASRQTYSAFHVERLEHRPTDRQAFVEGLKRNGPKAVAEWNAQVERWQARQAAASAPEASEKE
jgi:hypothetical protein